MVKKISAVLALAIALPMLGGCIQTAWLPTGFTEGPADQNIAFPDTLATDVAVLAPLPASFAAHPAECDSVHFLRIKHVKGPRDPSNADRILIAQPGILEGAGAFYNVAANLVTRAYAEKGKFVEFWAVDRRPNCLEDLNGLKLGKTSGDPHDLIDYYYRNKPYQGHHFAGYLNPRKDAEWLVDMGMEQTVKDWHEIITRGIPDQKVRQKKVYLGGHSLGGFIAGAYAAWDFDGNPKTTDDAGYNQAAGFFGLDTIVSAVPMSTALGGSASMMKSLIPADVVDQMQNGKFERYVNISGIIDPEVMNLLMGLGFAAQINPTLESDLIDYLPLSAKLKLTLKFYHSQNLATFLTPGPSLLKFRYTNQALFAIFTDDNAMPLSIVQASTGFFTGGPVADKNFPLPGNAAEYFPKLSSVIDLVAGPGHAIATDCGTCADKKDGPLYGWLNYNQLAGAAIPNDANGNPYTTPAREVTDINDFARSVGAWPMDFVEKYFPIRLAADSINGSAGAIHTDFASKRPIIDIIAGDGPKMGLQLAPANTPIIPGYNHIDVMTAAAIQNDGQPEKVTTNLLSFIFSE